MIEHSSSVRDLPPTLYKHLAFRPDLPNRVPDLLNRNLVWFASPLSFNDPFDCFPRIDLTGTPAERRDLYTRSIKRQALGSTRMERRRILADLNRGRPLKARKLFMSREGGETAWRDTIKNMGVLSLTSKPDDLLMWGHYSASHTGFCVRFDPAKLPFLLAYRVIYQEERPLFRVLDPDRSGLMDRVLLRKARAWEYEDEWRVLKGGGVGLVRFDPAALTGVVLGAAISAANEDHVREALAKRKFGVEVFRARIDGERYCVRIEPDDSRR